MSGKTSVRKQIYITEDEQRMLEQQSFVQKTSQAQVIRQALDLYGAILAGGRELENILKRLVKEDRTRNPLEKIIALFEDEVPGELSERHDRYIYGGEDA